jgi:hypothetical protein
MSSTGSETSNFASSTGDIAMSTGPGRAFVARALRVPSFGLMLCGVLAELGWGGWKLVRLSALLKTTPGLLQAEPTLMLRLLRFRNIPGSWVKSILSGNEALTAGYKPTYLAWKSVTSRWMTCTTSRAPPHSPTPWRPCWCPSLNAH